MKSKVPVAIVEDGHLWETENIMLYKNRPIQGPNTVIVAVPRPEGDIAFICKAVLNYDDFKAVCPEPQPRIQTNPKTGEKTVLVDEPDYRIRLLAYATSRARWTFWQSIKDTPDLVFQKINPATEPTSYNQIEDEFKESGFTVAEINHIYGAVEEANGQDEEKLKQARDRFLAAQNQVEVSTFPTGANTNI